MSTGDPGYYQGYTFSKPSVASPLSIEWSTILRHDRTDGGAPGPFSRKATADADVPEPPAKLPEETLRAADLAHDNRLAAEAAARIATARVDSERAALAHELALAGLRHETARKVLGEWAGGAILGGLAGLLLGALLAGLALR